MACITLARCWTGQAADYLADVHPIFQTHCVKCHGAEKQKGGLRLDTASGALTGGDSGKAILPGKSSESLLLQLVTEADPEKRMPPKGAGLSPAEVDRLRAWVNGGAPGPSTEAATQGASSHWSLQPIQRQPTPGVGSADGTNPIDHFIGERLKAAKIAPNPSASRATLLRRLSFDLTGLPPTPSELAEFEADRSGSAYERQVERLLASPRYGERWARHWLDLARFTESQGFEYDRLRDNAWHYRDYVIRSFNADKPYDLFMREQVAGDVLDEGDADSVVATSFLVCGPWDEAGNSQANSTQRAITREDELEDTIAVVGQTFLGLTINCARCHSHKFDPISQAEYYQVKSVFEGVKHGERPMATERQLADRKAQIAALQERIRETQALVASIELEGWKRAAAERNSLPSSPGPEAWRRWDFAAASKPEGTLAGGARLSPEGLVLPTEGAFFQTPPLERDIRERTLEVWVSPQNLEQQGGAAISLEREDGGLFDAIVLGERQKGKWMAGSSGFERTRDLDAPAETATPGNWVHLAAVYHADNRVALFRNGEPYGTAYDPGTPLRTYAAGKAHLAFGRRHKGGGRPWLTGTILRGALYDRALAPAEIRASFEAGGVVIPQEVVLSKLSAARLNERTRALELIDSLKQSIARVPPTPSTYAGTRVQPKPTRRLRRGDVKSPEEEVAPAALSAISSLKPGLGLAPDSPESARRKQFAAWLTDPANPLPARVMVNRLWHFHFGQGLVSTPNDFGVSGARPTHPELLDWLAARFIDSGWSLKAMHRLIVLSKTYRQSSANNPAAAAIDGDNTLLWRFAPRRLEAETVRDAMLAVSGELNPAMGGPSFRPFEVLKFPANAYQPVDKTGPEYNRRTVYRMNVNSGKEPMLDAFDCPDPSVKTPRRGVTTTPLQALALMNNSFVQRQASQLAARARQLGKNDLGEAIRHCYHLTLTRPPTAPEFQRARAVANERGLANLCWALLNSTEFVYVR